jgi:hypothetical protein
MEQGEKKISVSERNKTALEEVKKLKHHFTYDSSRPPGMVHCVELSDYVQNVTGMTCVGCGESEETAAYNALEYKRSCHLRGSNSY